MKKPFEPTPMNKLAILLIMITTSGLVLFLRMIDLQLVQGETFKKLADGNRFYEKTTPPERGVFLDRFGDPLVYNVPKYYELTSPTTLYSERTAIPRRQALELLAENPDRVEYDLERYYIFPQSTAPVLGYVGKVTAEDLVANVDLTITSTIGKMGLERVFDQKLQGVGGSTIYEINALGQKQRQVSRTPGLPGTTISTTLDPYLSEIAFQAMGDNRGAVVILDADSGEVLSLISTPTYNATTLSTTAVDPEEEQERKTVVQSFFTNPLQLFFNRAVAGAYPPGSVFKLITALAGLETKAISKETTVTDAGVLDVGEYSYANWYYTQYGRVEGDIDLVRAIARSNDIYFYKVAEWVGPTKLAQTAKLFGFGQKTGIELPGEISGIVPTPQWKEETIGEQWFLGNTFHMGIGQGDVLASPLQVAHAVQALANRGTQCVPRLTTLTERNCHEIGITESDLELVVTGMLDACSTGGTAFPFFEHNQAVRGDGQDPYAQVSQGAVACKTGTSEFGGVVDAAGHRKTHGWFAAFFTLPSLVATERSAETATSSAAVLMPADLEATTSAQLSPSQLHEKWLERAQQQGYPKRLVVVALVESDELNLYKEGSRDAAPVVKTIFDWLRVSTM